MTVCFRLISVMGHKFPMAKVNLNLGKNKPEFSGVAPMRYLTIFKVYLRGIRDCSDWEKICDLLMRIDSYNDCIEEIDFREKIERYKYEVLPVSVWINPSYPSISDCSSKGWYESMIKSLKCVLIRRYGIRVDSFLETNNKEEIIDGQISIEEYFYSLEPVFRISRPDLIEVHS